MPAKSISILGPDGRPLPSRSRSAPRRDLRGRYDAAVTNDENARHWANADGLSAAAANSPEVRRVLRNRSRYEVANNTYASGMVETLSNDIVGTGPRVQMETEDPEFNRRFNYEFEWWTATVGLAEILRTCCQSRVVDGEGIAILGMNPLIDSPVKLSITTIEADQLATPDLFAPTPSQADGIVFDRFGNPREYHILKQHPGDEMHLGFASWEYDAYPAARVLHWFKKRRPGQVRGIPELTSALQLFAQLRRYTQAVLSAAEIAALFAVVLKSLLPPEEDDDGLTPFDKQELARGMMTALPDGYEAQQLKPEHPTTTYPMFKHEVIGEAARGLNMPFNVASGNSSSYNYASGRLDHQVYHRAIGVDRYHLETAVLDRILAWWLTLWLASQGEGIADPMRPVSLREWPHQWFWDGFAHVDPSKEAVAQELRLANGTTTLGDEWAAEGHDWRAKARQIKAERDYYAELGIPYPGDATPSPGATSARSGADDDDE